MENAWRSPGPRRDERPWSGSWLVYGSSAHLAALRAVDAGLAVATGVLINARLVVFSVSLSRRWRGQPRWFPVRRRRVGDRPDLAVVERRADDGASDQAQRQYFLAAGVALGVGWSALVAVGVAAGGRIDGAGPGGRTRVAGAGTQFGEVELTTGQPHTTSATTRSETTAVVIFGPAFRSVAHVMTEQLARFEHASQIRSTGRARSRRPRWRWPTRRPDRPGLG